MLFDGSRVQGRKRREELELRRRIQPIFRILMPRWVQCALCILPLKNPLRIHKIGTKKECQTRVNELLDREALPSEMGRRFPCELSVVSANV